MTVTKARFVLAAALAVIADVATKVAAVQVLSATTVDLRIIELRLVRNGGVAFGMGGSVAPSVLVVLTACVAVALASGRTQWLEEVTEAEYLSEP